MKGCTKIRSYVAGWCRIVLVGAGSHSLFDPQSEHLICFLVVFAMSNFFERSDKRVVKSLEGLSKMLADLKGKFC